MFSLYKICYCDVFPFYVFLSKCLVKCISSEFAYHNFCLVQNKQL